METVLFNKVKCTLCKKKLTLAQQVSGKCKCGGTYCPKHRVYMDHSCTFDYSDKTNLIKNNPLIIAPKIEKI